MMDTFYFLGSITTITLHLCNLHFLHFKFFQFTFLALLSFLPLHLYNFTFLSFTFMQLYIYVIYIFTHLHSHIFYFHQLDGMFCTYTTIRQSNPLKNDLLNCRIVVLNLFVLKLNSKYSSCYKLEV